VRILSDWTYIRILSDWLDGLKTSAARFHEHLSESLLSLDFKNTKHDPEIWMVDKSSHYEYLATYVDDILIWSKDPMALIKSLEKNVENFQATSPLPIWIRLYDSDTRNQIKDTSAAYILRSSLVLFIVHDFWEAVKAELSNRLSSVDADELFVYKKEPIDNRKLSNHKVNEEPLKKDFSIVGLGGNKDEDALIVKNPNNW
jgi:hypothetical protein